jgi:AraC family transcriptional regulator
MQGIRASRVETAAGGGAFRLSAPTLGLFLVDQPGHRIALGGDRRAARPLAARQGWLLPAGAEGTCTYDAPHAFVTVEIPAPLWAEAGVRAVPQVIGDLDPMVVEMALQAPSYATRGALYAGTMARALVAQLGAAHLPLPPGPAVDDPRLRRALDLIEARLGEDLSLEDMAGAAGLSPFHFARAFKAALGASPLQYMIRRRVETAQVLLRTTRLPVAEVAYRCGYDDVSRFGAHFRRQTGATPAAWRAG